MQETEVKKACVVGGGAFGTALALVLARKGAEVHVWVRDKAQADNVNTMHENAKYLPGTILPDNVIFSTDITLSVDGAEIIIFAIPTQFLRSFLVDNRNMFPVGVPLVLTSKGIEVSTLLRMPCQIFEDELSGKYKQFICVLGGPAFAKEIAAGLLTNVCVAAHSVDVANKVQGQLTAQSANFRCYTQDDIIGCEVAGAVNNVLAIASGASCFFGLKLDACAALICRGLGEISVLTKAMGGTAAALNGLAGVGDLMLTCSSEMSRNFTVGMRIAKGDTLSEILATSTAVAEGIDTAKAVQALCQLHKVTMPICQAVYMVLYEGLVVQTLCLSKPPPSGSNLRILNCNNNYKSSCCGGFTPAPYENSSTGDITDNNNNNNITTTHDEQHQQDEKEQRYLSKSSRRNININSSKADLEKNTENFSEKQQQKQDASKAQHDVSQLLQELNFSLMANRSTRKGTVPEPDELITYNRLWAQKVKEVDPEYFHSHAKQQTPHYLWIGCSDSRVPECQIVGLAPGEIFVHRNVANVISCSDLNSLAVIQFAVEVLGIENIIVCGHYRCGGVKAAYLEAHYGLVDNWVMNVIDVKHRFESTLCRLAEKHRFAALVELNVLVQLCNVAESTPIQDWWHPYHNASDERGDTDTKPHPVTLHGWVYGLEEGLVHPLVKFNSFTNLKTAMIDAVEEVVERYKKLSEGDPYINK